MVELTTERSPFSTDLLRTHLKTEYHINRNLLTNSVDLKEEQQNAQVSGETSLMWNIQEQLCI